MSADGANFSEHGKNLRPTGTKMQRLAWELANPRVTEYASLASTLPEQHLASIEPRFRGALNLADAIVITSVLGLTKAAEFVSIVDPWRYPGDLSTAPLNVKGYIQSAVDKATEAGKQFFNFTEESKTDYLLSSLLLPKGKRPKLVAVPKKPRVLHSTGTEPVADLHSYAPTPLEEAPVATPSPIPAPTPTPTPRLTLGPIFSPGSIVRVLADTRPGVRPIHAEGILIATIDSYVGDGIYLVSERGSTRRRSVPADLVIPTSLDGASASFRGEMRGGAAGLAIARATSEGAKALKFAAMKISQAEKQAARISKAARLQVSQARKEASKVAAGVGLKVSRAAKLAFSTGAALVHEAESRALKAERKAAAAAKKAKEAAASAMASEAEKSALFSGDITDPRLSAKGRRMALVLNQESEVKRTRLERTVKAEKRLRIKAEADAARAKEDAAKAKEAEAKARALKNAALSARRTALAQTQHVKTKVRKLTQGESGRCTKATAELPKGVRERVEAAEADTVAAEIEAEALEGRVGELEETVKRLYKKLDSKSQAEFDRLRVTTDPGISLVSLLGNAGETYSQEIVELALRLMSSGLSGAQAVSVVRAFVAMLHPDQKEGPDYRIPSAKRFNEWRRYLEPICHFLAVSTIKLAVRTHLLNDATTKDHIHILMALYRCELPNGLIVDVPAKFMICPSGDAASEAKLIDESALHSDIAGGAHASHANCVSSQTDNAARATSSEMKKLKGAELDAAKALVEAHAAVPANMQHAVDCWLKLTPAQQDDAYEMHGLGCTGHSANLTTDDSHKHSESAALTTNMVHDRAARVIQRLRKAHVRARLTVDARTQLTEVELKEWLADTSDIVRKSVPPRDRPYAPAPAPLAPIAERMALPNTQGFCPELLEMFSWTMRDDPLPFKLRKGHGPNGPVAKKLKASTAAAAAAAAAVAAAAAASMSSPSDEEEEVRGVGGEDEGAEAKKAPIIRIVFKGYAGSKPTFDSGHRPDGPRDPVSLKPPGKHLNGGDMPSVPEVIRKTSMLLSSEGEHQAYYLNEHRPFNLFAKNRRLETSRLLSCKGSRQNYSVQQATRIVRNESAYLAYLHETRVESDANLLVEGIWDGLRDRYVLGALRARSFVDVAFTSPLIFFTHSDLVNRHMIGQVMEGAKSWIEEIGRLDNIGFKKAPPLQFLAEAILAKLPELRPGYESWWGRMGPELTKDYTAATDRDFWPLVSAHLVAASPFMLATHNRNLDIDCRDIPVLEHAAKTTDPVESEFAIYDYVLRLGAGFGATAGVAQSISMHAMETPGAMRHKAIVAVSRKRSHGLSGVATDAEQVAEQLAKWNTTSFFALPRERRWEIVVSVRKNYKAEAKAELLLLRKMDEAKAARQLKARQDEIEKHANRALKFHEFAAIPVVSSLHSLNALIAAHTDRPAELAEALRQQIRVRKYVYRAKSSELPYISAKPGHSSEDEAKRLQAAFTKIVMVALSPKPPAPTPFPVRGAAAAPSAFAMELDKAHALSISNAWRELIEVLNGKVVFKAPKAKPSKVPKAPGTQKPSKAKTRTTAPTPKAAKTPSIADRALEGAEFEEGGVEWKVLTVRWCSSAQVVVVWYYDVVEAEAGAVSEDQMTEAIDNGESYDCLEYSSVNEIRRWVKGAA